MSSEPETKVEFQVIDNKVVKIESARNQATITREQVDAAIKHHESELEKIRTEIVPLFDQLTPETFEPEQPAEGAVTMDSVDAPAAPAPEQPEEVPAPTEGQPAVEVPQPDQPVAEPTVIEPAAPAPAQEPAQPTNFQ